MSLFVAQCRDCSVSATAVSLCRSLQHSSGIGSALRSTSKVRIILSSKADLLNRIKTKPTRLYGENMRLKQHIISACFCSVSQNKKWLYKNICDVGILIRIQPGK